MNNTAETLAEAAPEPVPVSVLLTPEAVKTITNLCGALNTTRKDVITWITENHDFLYLDAVTPAMPTTPDLTKVQAEVSAQFLQIAGKAMKCDEKLVIVSSLMNQLLTEDFIDGRMLGFPESSILAMLQESLRWFRFGPAIGLNPAETIELLSAKLLRLDRIGNGNYRCYGIFTTPVEAPFTFGFRGTLWQGELQLDVLIPVSNL